MGRIHSTAEGIQAGTAGFGLIGALVGATSTAKMKTEIRASVQLESLKLVDTAIQSTVWTSSACVSTNFSAPFQATAEMVVFQHAGALLKRVVSELIQEIGARSHNGDAPGDGYGSDPVEGAVGHSSAVGGGNRSPLGNQGCGCSAEMAIFRLTRSARLDAPPLRFSRKAPVVAQRTLTLALPWHRPRGRVVLWPCRVGAGLGVAHVPQISQQLC